MRSVRNFIAALAATLFSLSLLAAPASADDADAHASSVVHGSGGFVAIKAHPVAEAVQSTCSVGHICIWSGAGYTGLGATRDHTNSGTWIPTPFAVRSAVSGYTDREVIFSTYQGGRVRCLNPGSAFAGPFPDGIWWMKIGAKGSRC